MEATFFCDLANTLALFEAFSRNAFLAAASCLFVLPPRTWTTLRTGDFIALFGGFTCGDTIVVIHELSFACTCDNCLLVGVGLGNLLAVLDMRDVHMEPLDAVA